MINKQSVLRILKERKARLTGSLFDDELEVELDVLINKISNLPEEDKWILCSEMYPEDPDEKYIVTNKYGEVDTATYDGLDYWDEYESREIVAWQPLPKPYRPPEKSWKESMLNKFLGGSSQ